MPNGNHQMTDHDYLVAIHGGLHGRGGVFDRLDALDRALSDTKTVAYEARTKAKAASDLAGKNEKRLNMFTSLNAGWTAIAAAVAGAIAYMRPGG